MTRPWTARRVAPVCLATLSAACGGERETPAAASKPSTAAPGSTCRIRLFDATRESGIDLRLTSGRTPSTQILEVKGGGLALIDHDGDGDQDLFVPNGATLDEPYRGPGARLYENRGSLRFADVTEAAGIEFHRWGFGPAVGDVDGDGRDDIYVACFGADALLMNCAGGRFDERAAASGVGDDAWSAAASFGDLDLDGDLDLYVANYLRIDPAHPPPPARFLGVQVYAGPTGLPPEPDRLYENLGDGRFRDASASSTCAQAPPSFGLGVVMLDFDQDGRLDIYVGNDSMRNFLFHNQGGLRFREMGLESGVGLNADGQAQATMGIAIGDVDGNELADIFTTNFANDTNTLHLNRGEMRFDDATARWGLGLVSRPFLKWATGFADFDLDGDEDLVVFNGHVYPEEIAAQLGSEHRQRPLLFERAASSFKRVLPPDAGAWLDEPHCDRSAAFGDLDLDGDVDMFVGELNGPVRVLRNDRTGGSWLSVELVDARPGHHDRHGYGSRVVLRCAGAVQTRWIHSGGSYQSASEPRAHFGMPPGSEPWEIEVTWSDGQVQQAAGSARDQRLRVERDAANGR